MPENSRDNDKSTLGWTFTRCLIWKFTQGPMWAFKCSTRNSDHTLKSHQGHRAKMRTANEERKAVRIWNEPETQPCPVWPRWHYNCHTSAVSPPAAWKFHPKFIQSVTTTWADLSMHSYISTTGGYMQNRHSKPGCLIFLESLSSLKIGWFRGKYRHTSRLTAVERLTPAEISERFMRQDFIMPYRSHHI